MEDSDHKIWMSSTKTKQQGVNERYETLKKLKFGDKIYDFTKMKENYAYLKNLPDIKVSMANVKVILSQDAYHLIRPLQYRPGDRNEPCS